MERIDLVRLRKQAMMSQRELADKLQVRPSFLSAIENGKSRIPDEKLEKLKIIFGVDNFDDYILESHDEVDYVPPHTHNDPGDSLTQLLTHIHNLAHQNDSPRNEEAATRIDYLMRRNDRLSERVDELRERVDELIEENLRLKELLVRNGIQY